MRQVVIRGLIVVAAVLAVTATVSAAGSADVVKVNVAATKPDANGNQTITIDLDIDKEWHIYASPVGNDTLATAETKVTLEGKQKLSGVKIEYPAGKVVKDKDFGDYYTYEGKVQIKTTVNQKDGPFKVAVKFQACNDKGKCLIPSVVDKSVE